ncbi:MAG TPA: hypothetical protein VMW74_02415 [Nitrosopumilaceae archaeon]|nr:hypothetical protein [Nitrosopumilaceae archaeon]
MSISKQSIPIKYFIFFILGLLILNFIVSVYIPVLEYASKDGVSQYVDQVFGSKTAWFIGSWILVAPTGIVLIPVVPSSLPPSSIWVFLRIVLWTLAISSIPLTVKLTPKLPKVASIFVAYFVSVNIAAIGFIVWSPDSGH